MSESLGYMSDTPRTDLAYVRMHALVQGGSRLIERHHSLEAASLKQSNCDKGARPR